jgi:hypothetical protein
MLRIVAQVCNFSTEKLRKENYQFKGNLDYIGRFFLKWWHALVIPAMQDTEVGGL